MNRALHHAILLSLALHGLLLFGVSLERKAVTREPPSPAIEARLVEPPAAPPQQLEAPKPPPRVEKPAPRPKPRPRIAKPAPAPLPLPQPQSEPEPKVPAPVAEPAAPAPPSVARVEPRPAPPGPSAEQLEAMTREQYRLALIDAARRHNRYPPLARENNWEGEVGVRMEVRPDGSVALGIERSSGHPVLDRQAIEMFRRAQAQVALPASLRGKSLSFRLRAIYNLKDQVSG